MADEYTAEDYVSFIEQRRRDKISPHALDVIAARFREQETSVSKLRKERRELLDLYDALSARYDALNKRFTDYRNYR
jgi:uncharacterized coiled-coil DUF342 family protein